MVAAATGVSCSGHDPTGRYARWRQQQPGRFVLDYGLVTRSGVGGYDCSVKIGKADVPCVELCGQSSQGFGVSSGDIPLEGSTVLVCHRENDFSCGMIVGVVPRSRKLTGAGQTIKPKMYASYPESATSVFSAFSAYNVPYKGKPTPMSSRMWSNADRFSDIVPGESFITNENRCGLIETMYDVELTGGAAFIRVGRIDDEIKIRSTNLTKWTNHQSLKEFNDGGLISAEGKEYSYQGEYLGSSGRKLNNGYKNPVDVRGKETKPRTRWWRGFLGNLLSWFAVRPKQLNDEFETGLASVHVSQAGNIMVRAAGGVSLERYDSIPVPDRRKAEWDPEGDREVDVVHSAFSPFFLNDPHAIGLLKSSKMAWEQRTAYQRFDELEKDFKVPQEADANQPGNNDEDPFMSRELNLDDYKGRKAGVFIGDDGSVIIRDAWGSEIVMEGGNITINTPGNVVTTANRSVVSIAGQTVALRGARGADLTSDKGHVHIQSNNVVEIAGGSDSSRSGGVLIESLADSTFVMADKEAGDQAAIGGVVIRSEKAGVSLSGKNTYVTGLDNVFVTGGDTGDTRDGSIYIDGRSVITTAKSMAATVVETTACIVGKKTALLCSNEGSALVAGKSAMILNGDQVPAWWVSAGASVNLASLKKIWDLLQNSDVIQPMDWQNLVKNALFSFRKSSELQVENGMSPWKPGNGFRMYEPYWQVMKDLGVDTVTSTPVKLRVNEVHGSVCWPGKTAVEKGKFVAVRVEDLNVDGKDMLSKDRDKLMPDISVQEKSFTEFAV